jgi:hypothetical protein
MDAEENELNTSNTIRNKVLVVGNLDCHAVVKSALQTNSTEPNHCGLILNN